MPKAINSLGSLGIYTEWIEGVFMIGTEMSGETRTAIVLMLDSGMRLGECLCLTVDDVHLTKR